jgi:SAM-dependent methyltransferase
MSLLVNTRRQAEILSRQAVIRAYRSPELSSVYQALERSTDLKRVEQLKQEMASAHAQDHFGAAKYADFPCWLIRNIHRAGQLGLHTGRRLRILDIGCGPGYFIAVARALGHECWGIDLPAAFLTSTERHVYAELLGALHCRQYVSALAIERFAHLDLREQKYDLITAFLVCFNRHTKPDQWGVPEWRYFVQDALSRLSPGGRLYMGLNDNPQRFGRLKFYDEELLSYFRSVGSVDGARITIVNKPAFKQETALQASAV